MNNVYTPPLSMSAEEEHGPGRDLFTVAQFLDLTDAHLARGCLESAGIPAVMADDQHAQAYSLLIPAMGGVRVLVPEAYLEEAKAMLAARERGDFALDDDADVGDPESA